MKVRHRTPRSEMALRALIKKSADLPEALGKKLGFESADVDAELFQFLRLSAQIEPGKGELDFELAQATDTPDEIAVKFIAYLDTECLDALQPVLEELYRQDRAVLNETAPQPPETDDPN